MVKRCIHIAESIGPIPIPPTMEKTSESKLLNKSLTNEYERSEEFVSAKAGSDSRQHKYRAKYKVEEWQETHADGSVKKSQKTTLVPNSLEDLGPVEKLQTKPEDTILKKAA